MWNSSIWPIDWTLSGATTLGQSEPGRNGNKGILHILQVSKTGALLSDCLMSYPGRSLVDLTPLQRCSKWNKDKDVSQKFIE